MIAGRDFVVFSDSWDGLPTSTVHLFRKLGSENRVFWFNITTRMPRWTWRDFGKVAATMAAWGGQLLPRQRSDANHAAAGNQKFFRCTPLMVPYFKPWVRRWNAKRFSARFAQLAGRHGISNPIVLSTFPCAVDYVKSIDGGLKLYYCVDDWLNYPGLNASVWETMEKELVHEVHGLVATSRDLRDKCRNGCPSLYLPHGVDFAHFHDAALALEAVPEMDCIPRPIVGFFGILAEWINVELIAALSKAFPTVSFVLIGRADVPLDPLAGCPNVHYLGPKPYAELPRYACHFDIGLIPFRINDLTKAVNPIKLLEYYSLGLPVLATRLPEMESSEGPIRLAETEGEFCDQLRALLAERCPAKKQAAFAVAAGNTWENRVEQLSAFIHEIES